MTRGMRVLADLRKMGVTADTDYENKSLKACMRKANDLNARMVLILGEDELKKEAITIKDMANGVQKEVSLLGLEKEIKC